MTEPIEAQASDQGPSPAATLEILSAGLELLSDGVALFDRDFRLVACNQQTEQEKRDLLAMPARVAAVEGAQSDLQRDAINNLNHRLALGRRDGGRRGHPSAWQRARRPQLRNGIRRGGGVGYAFWLAAIEPAPAHRNSVHDRTPHRPL